MTQINGQQPAANGHLYHSKGAKGDAKESTAEGDLAPYETIVQGFDSLAADNPDYMKKVVLGKSGEGRDIVAYKFSMGAQGDTSEKPGVVFTGSRTARHQNMVEAPLTLGKSLLENIADDPGKQALLNQGEIWIQPVVNPDGYEFSRSTDDSWRKNLRPSGVGNTAPGVDLNRFYRDDSGSSVPPVPTPEADALQSLVFRPNIRGVADLSTLLEPDIVLHPWDTEPKQPVADQSVVQLGFQIADSVIRPPA